MKVTHCEKVDQQTVDMPGTSGCTVRWLIGKSEDAPNFAMRQFSVDPQGHTPKHFHPYEHEVYVLSGNGVILEGDEEHAISRGDVIYVAPNEIHQFKNTGTSLLEFLCLIPNSAYDAPITAAPECGIES